MAPLKFAANLAFMFREHSNVLHRYEAARKAGFKGVECAFLYDLPIDQVVDAKRNANGIKQVLINSHPGDLSCGEMGYAALPNKVELFRETLKTSIEYCKRLDCNRLHIMAGKCPAGDQLARLTFLDNLKYAAQQLANEGILGLIEPINSITVPGYFLNDYEQAVNYIKEVNSPNIKLQLDLFHMQHITGNLTNNLKAYFPYVGNIQIAQVPFRGEPNTFGEIRFDYVFKLLEELGYDGWIGCEYIPKGKTEEGLTWLQEYGLSL